MPAAGRSCRQSVRHSVRLSDLRRRRRLLSPDARGPPSAAGAAAAPRGDGRRPRPALPCPRLLPSVCASVRPSAARSRFGPPVPPPAFRPVPLLRLLCPPRLAVSLSLPSRFLPAPPSLPDLWSHLKALHSSQPPFLGASILWESPAERPQTFWSGLLRSTLFSIRPPPASSTSSGGPPFNLYPSPWSLAYEPPGIFPLLGVPYSCLDFIDAF